MPSESITLTAVQLDLVNSTEFIKDIYERLDLDNEGLRIFIDKIAKVVSEAFDKSVNSFNNELILTRNDSNQAAINNAIPNLSEKPNFNRIADAMADGYRLTFESVECAYLFVQDFCRLVEERNKKPGIGKWVFRIGAATGSINCDNLNINRMVAYTLLEVKELETGAYPGWFFVDQSTYDTLSEDIKHNFSQKEFTTKHQKVKKQAWGCQMISDASLPTAEPITLEEIYAAVTQPLPTLSVIPPESQPSRESKSDKKPRVIQIRIENLKRDLDKLTKDYNDVADKKIRESNPQEENNLQLQLDDIAKKMEKIEQQLQELGYKDE